MRELTPDQHAKIRFQLVLIPVYVWLVFSWSSLFVRLPFGALGAEHLHRDFAHFYVQGAIANERNVRALYDRDEQAAVLHRVVARQFDARFPPVHGPQISLLFSPLARLSYVEAMYVWLTITVVAYLACGYAVWRVCPRLRDRFWTVFLLLLAAPALRFDLGFAQTAVIGLVCVTAAALALRAERPFLAGLAIGSLAYKPQLGLAAAFVFLCARERAIVLGAITAAVAQLAAGALYWGPGILASYVGALGRIPEVTADLEPFKFDMHSWRAFFELLKLPAPIAMTAYVVASIFTLVTALACWRAHGPLALRYSALLIATVLVDPHMWVYDFLLLTPLFLLLWDWVLAERERPVGDVLPWVPLPWLGRRSFPAAFQVLLYLCYVSPVFGIAAKVIRVQVSVVLLSLLGIVAGSLLHATSRVRDTVAPVA